jgi:hypothetical protein
MASRRQKGAKKMLGISLFVGGLIRLKMTHLLPIFHPPGRSEDPVSEEDQKEQKIDQKGGKE